MKSLLLLFVVQFALRLMATTVEETVLASIPLIPMLIVAAKLGGWTSPRAAWRWLSHRRLLAVLEVGGTVGMFVMMLVYSNHSLLLIIAETIGAFFFLHFFAAIGEWVRSRMSARGR